MLSKHLRDALPESDQRAILDRFAEELGGVAHLNALGRIVYIDRDWISGGSDEDLVWFLCEPCEECGGPLLNCGENGGSCFECGWSL
jgi:hypothetical protein